MTFNSDGNSVHERLRPGFVRRVEDGRIFSLNDIPVRNPISGFGDWFLERGDVDITDMKIVERTGEEGQPKIDEAKSEEK